jgi:hypothetical protein
MSEEEEKNNLRSLDAARVKRLQMKGHMGMLIDDFEKLRLKFYYDKLTDKAEVLRFITLLKYFKENGPTEAFRLSCEYMYDRYCAKWGL